MALFVKIVGFLCTLGVLLLFRSGGIALLKEPDRIERKKTSSPAECARLTPEELLDSNAPKGSEIYMFRKEVQEALAADIIRASVVLKAGASESVDSSKAGKAAYVVEAVSNVDAEAFIAQWKTLDISGNSDIVVLQQDDAVVQAFKQLGCGTTIAKCLISDVSSVNWDSYRAVVLVAPLEELPKKLPAEIPTAIRSNKSVSTSAKNHAKWVARKLGLYNDGVDLELTGSMVIAPKSASSVLSLRKLLVNWLEAYEFSKYEKAEAIDDDYWPWPRRVQIANMIIGNFLKAKLVDI
jgi:hypothetical protein